MHDETMIPYSERVFLSNSRESIIVCASAVILVSSLTGCIEEPLGIAYQVDGQIYIQAPCGNQITSLEVRGDNGLVAEFAAPDVASAPQVVALASTTEGLTITGPLVGDLRHAGWNMVLIELQPGRSP